jgi:hypothetical protein
MRPAANSGRLPPDVVRAWLVKSCADQGVPELVCDPVVLSRVAALMGRGVTGRSAASEAGGLPATPDLTAASARSRGRGPTTSDRDRRAG